MSNNTKQEQVGKLTLQNVRLSFANLWEPKSKFGGPPRYEANFIIDPKTIDGKANLTKFKSVIRQIEARDLGGMEMPDDKLPYKDGDTKDYDGWQGMVIIPANDRSKPKVLNRSKQPVAEGEDGAPYSGCMVDALIKLWAMNNDFGKRICASLVAVRFREDGEPFGGTSVSDDDFADLPEPDDSEDDLDAE